MMNVIVNQNWRCQEVGAIEAIAFLIAGSARNAFI
jgi:hypothetical protein